MTGLDHRPPSLRGVLDYGLSPGDLLPPDALKMVTEQAADYVPVCSPAQRDDMAAHYRRTLDEVLEGLDRFAVVAPVTQVALTQLLWSAEVLEDPSLARRYLAAV